MSKFTRPMATVDANYDEESGRWWIVDEHGNGFWCDDRVFRQTYQPVDRDAQLELELYRDRQKPLSKASIDDLLMELAYRANLGQIYGFRWRQQRGVEMRDGKLEAYPPSFNVITFIRFPKASSSSSQPSDPPTR